MVNAGKAARTVGRGELLHPRDLALTSETVPRRVVGRTARQQRSLDRRLRPK